MWFFNSPRIIFGQEALSWLGQFTGRRAFIVTDANMVALGYAQRVQDELIQVGIESEVFAEVEPDPCLATVKRCAVGMSTYAPDWIIGLGGGSCLDAAKAAWFLYERPDVDLESVTPLEEFGLRAKARLITIPTTAGSGAEVTAAAVIKDSEAGRKVEIASYELVADYAIIDPVFSAHMPPPLTADTGVDALTHAIEGYTSTWANDFSDALCLHATRLVFDYLPRAVECGAADFEAREKMANAATIAALGMGNSHIVLAHALGHSAGAIFQISHGRVTGLFLPYTIEFTANSGQGRYLDLANMLGLPASEESEAARSLAEAVRSLMRRIGLPLNLQEAGISREEFESNLESLCNCAEIDISLVTTRRVPTRQELARLFQYSFDGRTINF
jgi:alcohol dehydrogenase class IV